MVLAQRFRRLSAVWLCLALLALSSAASGQVRGNLLHRGPGAESHEGYASRREAFRAARRDARVPNAQRPLRVERVAMTDRSGRAVLDHQGRPVMTSEYHFVSTRGEHVVIQNHAAGHTFSDHGHEGPHYNVRPAANTRNGSLPGARPHYSFPARFGR